MQWLEILRRIWLEEGPNPAYHRAQQGRLQDEWPTLYNFMVVVCGKPGTRRDFTGVPKVTTHQEVNEFLRKRSENPDDILISLEKRLGLVSNG